MIFALTSSISKAQTQLTKPNTDIKAQEGNSGTYKLFPTQNYWTFIKLNTRNGKMWQVHFTIDEDGENGELILNPLPLVNNEKELNGRFTLYPTENIYNFILLDQIDGNVYQAQWSMEEKYRGVIPIY
jgi:hypothetical protein